MLQSIFPLAGTHAIILWLVRLKILVTQKIDPGSPACPWSRGRRSALTKYLCDQQQSAPPSPRRHTSSHPRLCICSLVCLTPQNIWPVSVEIVALHPDAVCPLTLPCINQLCACFRSQGEGRGMVSLLSWSWEKPASHVVLADLFWYLRFLPQGVIAFAAWEPELLRMNAPSVLWRNSLWEKKLLFYWSIERCGFCHGLA